MGLKTAAKSSDIAAQNSIEVHIGTILRRIRKGRRMSMDALGRRVGVTYQQIQKYETGGNRIPASTLYRLARILRCDLGVFYEGIDAPGVKEHGLQVSREDVQAANSLYQIEDPVVRKTLRDLIVMLDSRENDV